MIAVFLLLVGFVAALFFVIDAAGSSKQPPVGWTAHNANNSPIPPVVSEDVSAGAVPDSASHESHSSHHAGHSHDAGHHSAGHHAGAHSHGGHFDGGGGHVGGHGGHHG